MTNTKSTFVKKIKRMSRKAPMRIVALVLAVLLVMNVTSILTNLSVFAQTQEDYAVIGIEMNGKTSVVEYRAKDDCSLVVAVYDDDGAKMLGSGNTTVSADKQSAEVEISIDELPQHYFVKAFLVNPVNNYPLCFEFVYQSVTLSNLESDEEYFVCGLDNVITFTVDVTGSPDSVQLYKNNTELVGEMHDDGLNGDETAGDGKYSCVINENISIDNTITINYFARYENIYSNQKSLCFFEELSDASDKLIVNTNFHINEIVTNYTDENGCIEIDEVATVISAVAEYIKQLKDDGTIIWYEVNEENILIRFASGFLMAFAPNIKDFQSGSSTVSIATFQPFNNTLLYSTVPDDTAKIIEDELDSYSFDYDYDNDEVTLDEISSVFSDNQVIIWYGHGGHSYKYHSVLATGQNCDIQTNVSHIFDKISKKWPTYTNKAALSDNTQGVIIPVTTGVLPVAKWAFTYKFIDKYCNTMNHSFIWLGACESGKDNVLANSFLNKGATAVVGYSDTVIGRYNCGIMKSTIEYLLKTNINTNKLCTLDDALKISKKIHGPTDKSFSSSGKGAEAKIFGGAKAQNYRLINIDPPKKGYLSGIICQDTNNSPISGAEIYYSQSGGSSANSSGIVRSDASGKFSLNVPVGNYTITVHASGYSWNRTTAIVKENQTTNVTVKLAESTGNEECPWDDLPDDDWSDDIFDPGDLSDDVEVGLCGNQVRWNFSRGTGTLTLSGKGATYDYASADDVPWKNLRDSITSVEIDKNITYLGDRLFEYCSKIKNVNIPNKVSGIGESVFFECRSLTKVEIPSSVVYLGKTAFYNCTGLQSVSISYGLQTIGEFAFGKCSEITQISIPNSVTKIEKEAFSECTNLQSVKLPDSLSEIAEKLFYKCSNLTSVVLPDTVTSIGANAFNKCQKITAIDIPDSVISIKEGAFSECSKLVNVQFGNTLKTLEKAAFYKTALQRVILPDSLESIGPFAFQGCWNLNKVIIPESVKSVGLCAFTDARNLKTAGPIGSDCNIEFGWKKNIPNNAFSCNLMAYSYLQRVILPDTIEVIGNSAFWWCQELREINLPPSLKRIEKSAFEACSKLKNVEIPSSVTT